MPFGLGLLFVFFWWSGVAAFGVSPTLAARRPTATPTPTPAPARITFFSALCPSSSSLYRLVQTGGDPKAADNGSAEAVPADVAAYGCAAGGDFNLFVLGGSSANSLFLDASLSAPAVFSSSANGYAGQPSLLVPGQSFYVPANQFAIRRFAVKEFPVYPGAYSGLPFLDLQCYTDGINNDNADGVGWSNQSLNRGQQVHCLLYSVPTPTPSPTLTPTPTSTPAPSPTPNPPGPISAAEISPSRPDGLNDWYTKPVDVRILASDIGSGVKSINWQLNDSSWNAQTFSYTLNLAPNPSFEDGTVPPVTSWGFLGPPSSLGYRDAGVSKFGIYSARIASSENGWSRFRNSASYIPAAPFSQMTASVWLKTADVSGDGAFFRVYTLSSGGSTLAAESVATIGTKDWTRIAVGYYVPTADAYGVYLELGLAGTGAVWFDGVNVNYSSVDTAVNQTISQNGENVLEYFSVNNIGTEEVPHNSLSFQLDTFPPTNWQDFLTRESGNDHTLQTEIKVEDPDAGLDDHSAVFQYSVDGGQSWGYSAELEDCRSSWVSNGWLPLGSQLTEGGKKAILQTPTIDFCDSNWAVCKTVRFKISDLAGNTSDKDVCIYGSWFSATGDVGSRDGISLTTAGDFNNSDGVVFSGSAIENFTSANGWYVSHYLLPEKPSYSELYARFPTLEPLPSGKLPTTSGLYLNGSSLTINASTLPSGFVNAVFAAVVYVDGDLTINSDLSLSEQSALVFVVVGDVKIDKNVGKLAGFFVSDGEIDTSHNGNSQKDLEVSGSFVAESVSFGKRLRGRLNHDSPAVRLRYQSIYLAAIGQYLGSGDVTWKEVSP